jgi:hypothetical protein
LTTECRKDEEDFYLPLGEGCYSISVHSAAADFDSSTFRSIPDADDEFTSGIRLLSYQWVESPNACLSLAMTPLNGPQPVDYTFAIHFINAQKSNIAGADSVGWHGYYWRKGDTIVESFCLQNGLNELPDIVGAQVGMYTYEDLPDGRHFHNLDVVDRNGTPIGQSVEILFRSASGLELRYLQP